MKRPLLWTVGFLIMGILAGRFLGAGGKLYFYGVIIIASCIISLCYKTKSAYILIVFSWLGIFLMQNVVSPKSYVAMRYAQTNQSVDVTGIVRNVEALSENYVRFTLENSSFKADYEFVKGLKLYVGFSPERLPQAVSIKEGDEITVTGKIAVFEPPDNPGGFQEKQYYLSRYFDYKLNPETVLLTGERQENWKTICYQFREKINSVYDKVFPAKEAEIVKAMITGTKYGLYDETKEMYRKSGIFHILAISGLHISILAMAAYFLLNTLLHLPKRLSSVLVMGFLFSYMIFTGCSVSVVRAVIMCSVMLMGAVVNRESDTLSSLAFAAICLLCYQPLYLWDTGFLLSFSAVAGIVLFGEYFKKAGLPRFLQNTIGLSISSFLATAPILAHVFYYVTPVSILINLVVIPFLGIIIVFAILVGLIGLVSIKTATFFGGIVYAILSFYELICVLFVKLGFREVWTGSISIVLILVFYFLLVCVLVLDWKKRYAKGMIVLTTALFLFLSVAKKTVLPITEITFLDVGQGDCAVIETSDRQTFLIDGGGRGYQGLGKNVGISIVKPFLEYKNTQWIDIIFLSHMDADHALGVLELMEVYPVKAVAISDYEFEDSLIEDYFYKILEQKNITLYKIKQGNVLKISDTMSFHCLYPMEQKMFTDGDDNHGSMVLKFSVGEHSVLFTGDITAEDEKLLVESNTDLEVDILKVSHHGSAYSTSRELLDSLSAKYAIISSGRNNTYGHPADSVLDKLNEYNIKFFNTAYSGAATVYFTEKELYITTTKKGFYHEGTEKSDKNEKF